MNPSSTPDPSLAAIAPGAAADALQVGDVLLMLGDGPLSQLIAWCGDSIYSHAALVADGGDLIEASAVGVRRYALAQRLADTVNYHFIDASRPLDNAGQALQAADRAAVLAHAQSLLGVPYPLDMLATLGVVLAVRGKVPGDPWVRLVVREALDHVIRNDPSHMVCSEVVYRAFAECDAVPAGRLAPRIVLEPRGTAPFPHIDLKALWDEVWPLIRPDRRAVLGPGLADLHSVGVAAEPPPAVQGLDDASLAAQLAQARGALGLQRPPAPLRQANVFAAAGVLGTEPDVVVHPNPKLVTPLDLAATPSHVTLGRVMARPGG
jgi:hypothetical protein